MLEYEKKILLKPEEYRILTNIWARRSLACFAQTNYYYDTDDYTMSAQGVTYRIRVKDGICEATVKEHDAGENECSVETSKRILSPDDDGCFTDLGLKRQGTLTTQRIVISTDGHTTAMLDRNVYLGVVDYELEIEYPPGYEGSADRFIFSCASILRSVNLITDADELGGRANKAKSKSARFFERKRCLSQTAE